MKKLFEILTLAFLALFLWVFPAQAKITLNNDFKGTIVITLPNGEISLIEPGDPVPEIPSGSTLEVFDGNFTLATQEGDTVQLTCLGSAIGVGGGGSASLSCAEETGLLKVLTGSAHVKGPTDKESDVAAGTEYAFKGGETTDAPPTAATDPTGLPLAEDQPIDSRSIDSSPT